MDIAGGIMGEYEVFRFIKGKYERIRAENQNEFFLALDFNFLLRKAATASTPVMEVSILEISFCHFEILLGNYNLPYNIAHFHFLCLGD